MISVSLFLGFSHLNSIFWVFVTFPVFFMKYKYETPQKMIADITYTVDVCGAVFILNSRQAGREMGLWGPSNI